MKKSTKILLSIILLIFLLLVFSFLRGSGDEESVSPLPEKPMVKEEEFVLTSWEDPAGFSFDYPEILEIDIHEEDEVNYAHLELTREGSEGRILIIANDSDYATLGEWLEEDKEVKGDSSLDTEVAGVKAKRVASGEGKEITALIDLDQVIYQIIKEPEGEDSWQQIYRIILDSFELIPLEGESEAEFQNWMEGFETSAVDIVEPVEIIE